MLARRNGDGVERVAWEEGGKVGRMRERQCPEKKDDGGEVARGAGIPAADGGEGRRRA